MEQAIKKITSAILWGMGPDGKTYEEYAKITYNANNDKFFDIELLDDGLTTDYIYSELMAYAMNDRTLGMEVTYRTNTDWLLTSYIYSYSNYMCGMKEVNV